MNPIPGMAAFLTCHCGFLEVYLLDVNDLVQEGFTVARVADFFKEAEQTFLDSMPKFGLTPGDHLFVPTGVIPLVVATGASWFRAPPHTVPTSCTTCSIRIVCAYFLKAFVQL